MDNDEQPPVCDLIPSTEDEREREDGKVAFLILLVICLYHVLSRP